MGPRHPRRFAPVALYGPLRMPRDVCALRSRGGRWKCPVASCLALRCARPLMKRAGPADLSRRAAGQPARLAAGRARAGWVRATTVATGWWCAGILHLAARRADLVAPSSAQKPLAAGTQGSSCLRCGWGSRPLTGLRQDPLSGPLDRFCPVRHRPTPRAAEDLHQLSAERGRPPEAGQLVAIFDVRPSHRSSAHYGGVLERRGGLCGQPRRVVWIGFKQGCVQDSALPEVWPAGACDLGPGPAALLGDFCLSDQPLGLALPT